MPANEVARPPGQHDFALFGHAIQFLADLLNLFDPPHRKRIRAIHQRKRFSCPRDPIDFESGERHVPNQPDNQGELGPAEGGKAAQSADSTICEKRREHGEILIPGWRWKQAGYYEGATSITKLLGSRANAKRARTAAKTITTQSIAG